MTESGGQVNMPDRFAEMLSEGVGRGDEYRRLRDQAAELVKKEDEEKEGE